MFCSNCGSQVKDDAAFCHQCGHLIRKIESTQASAQPAEAAGQPPVSQAQGPVNYQPSQTKKCACCGAVNEKDAKACYNCQSEFDKLFITKEAGKKVARITCPNCGEVYKAEKNKIFIAIMAVLGILLIEFFPIALVFLVLAVIHATGGLQGVYKMDCPCCHRKYKEIKKTEKKAVDMQVKQKELILLTKITPEELATPLDEREKLLIGKKNMNYSLSYLMVSWAILPFIASMFIPGDLTIKSFGVSKSGEMFFGDILINYGNFFHAIAFGLAAVSIVVASIMNLIVVAKLKKYTLLAGMISAGLQTIFAISVFAMSQFKIEESFYDEAIAVYGHSEAFLPGLLILLGAALIAGGVYLGYKQEMKLQKLKLRANNNQ